MMMNQLNFYNYGLRKKYKNALEKARQFSEHPLMEDSSNIVEYLFPELKESEDERIRKEIINYFRCQSRDEPSRKDIHNKWIAWLEKQGEPTEINPSEFDLRLNKLLKQFESLPKEELISNLSYYLNVIQNDGTYKIEKQGKEAITIDADPEASYNNIMISDTKNNKKQGEKPQRMISAEAKEALYNKPAWSEEDEEMLSEIITDIKSAQSKYPDSQMNQIIIEEEVNWLKTIKQRIGG